MPSGVDEMAVAFGAALTVMNNVGQRTSRFAELPTRAFRVPVISVFGRLVVDAGLRRPGFPAISVVFIESLIWFFQLSLHWPFHLVSSLNLVLRELAFLFIFLFP